MLFRLRLVNKSITSNLNLKFVSFQIQLLKNKGLQLNFNRWLFLTITILDNIVTESSDLHVYWPFQKKINIIQNPKHRNHLFNDLGILDDNWLKASIFTVFLGFWPGSADKRQWFATK